MQRDPICLGGNDFEALVEYIEENPGEVSFGGQGLGNLAHFLHNKALPLEELDYTYAPLGGGADVYLVLKADMWTSAQ